MRRAGVLLALFAASMVLAVKELDPPDGCEGVQEKGEHAVGGFAAFAYGVPKNLTPYLGRRLPAILEQEIAKLAEIEAEAEACATS